MSQCLPNFFLSAVTANVATESPSNVSLSADRGYGVPPHTVKLQATVADEPLDFRDHKLHAWYEDKQNKTTIEDDGSTLHMVGNAAKMIELNYEVGANTIVEFDFRCDRQGEIHGLGFDNDAELDVAADQRLFVLHGSEGWGAANNLHRNYQPNQDGWMRYRIRVGCAYQGRFRYLVFMNDHDVDRPTAVFATSRFMKQASPEHRCVGISATVKRSPARERSSILIASRGNMSSRQRSQAARADRRQPFMATIG